MGYARWRKCDFQIHTPRDPNWKGQRPAGIDDSHTPSEADVDSERKKWAERFVDHCVSRGLEAIAITDHHEMVMVPYVEAEILRRKKADSDFDIWLFPGLELTCSGGVQCLILFDAELPELWRREAQSHLGISTAAINPYQSRAPKVTQLTRAYPDLADGLDQIPELKGRYIILPNVSQGGQYTVLTHGAHIDFKRMPYVGGYLDNSSNINSISGTNKRRLSGEDEIWGDRFIYPLPTSDARSDDYAKLGSNNSWIKLSNPTAEAIRQAFLAHKSRISISKPSTATIFVKSLCINESSIIKDTEIMLSSEFNSVIGGRGSGKSTILEYIAFGLGRSCFDIPKDEYSGKDRLRKLIEETVLNVAASIQLEIVQDNAVFKVIRKKSNNYNPIIVYPNHISEEVSVKELRSLFNSVVYCQGELSELGKQAGSNTQISDLMQFVSVEYKHEDDRLNIDIENAKTSVRNAAQDLMISWSQEAKIHNLTTKKSQLEQRITALENTLPELPSDDRSELDRHEALAALNNSRELAEKQIGFIMTDVGSLTQYTISEFENYPDIKESVEFGKAYDQFIKNFQTGVQKLTRDLSIYAEELTKAGVKIQTSFSSSKEKRNKIMSKLTEHRAVTAQIEKLRNELHLIISEIADINSKLTPSTKRDAVLRTYLQKLKDSVILHANKTKEWADKIENLSNNRIKARVNHDHDLSDIIDAVDILSAKTGSHEANRHQRVRTEIENYGVWPFIDTVQNECLFALRWKLLSSLASSNKPEFKLIEGIVGGTARILDNFTQFIDLQRLSSILTAIPKPEIELYYCDTDHQIPFEAASEGQRAAALLFMLLEQAGGPLIIDQPEGDLDNKIVSSLSEILHTAKTRRQIIFASHNANIVVNGAAELVVSMGVTPDAKRGIACSGAIDSENVRSAITETMEGGKKAFQDRKAKYGY